MLLVWFAVNDLETDSLELERISRLHMGAYLCIASNGVPPSVSKRIKVSVDCKFVNESVDYLHIPEFWEISFRSFAHGLDTASAGGHSHGLQCYVGVLHRGQSHIAQLLDARE